MQLLFQAITEVQQAYISGKYTPERLFENLLHALLSTTGSQCGFIGKVTKAVDTQRHAPTLEMYTVVQAQDDACPTDKQGIHTLVQQYCQQIVVSQQVLIQQNIKVPNAKATCIAALKELVCIPLVVENEVIGIYGVAHKTTGYTREEIDLLAPLTATCAMLVKGIEQQRQLKRQRLNDNNYYLEQTLLQLKKHQVNFKKVKKIAKLAHWEWYPETSKVVWSRQAYHIFEVDFFTFEPTLDNILAYIDKEDVPKVFQKNERLIKEGVCEPDTIKIITQKGNVKYLHTEAVEIKKNIDGRVIKLLGIMQDITHQKTQEIQLKENLAKTQELNEQLLIKENELEKNYSQLGKYTKFLEETRQKLKVSEQKYKYLFDKNPLPMLVVDSETLQFLNVNRAARTLYGYTVKEFKQMTALDIRPKTVEKDFLSILNHLNSRRKLTHNGIWQHLTRKKKIIDVEIFSHSLEYEGKLATLFLVNDVTQRVLMQRKLSESQAHLQSILDATYQAYLLIGVNHKVLKFNRVADQMVKRYFYKKIIEGDSILDYVGEMNKEDFKDHFQRAFNGEKVLIQRPLNINEYQAYVDVQYLPAYNKYGKIFAVAFVLTDITERKKAEEERQELLKNLANFAFITSHNLRRPLANVLGLVSLFDTEDDDFNRMLIEKLKYSARELDKIIYDMNDLLKHKELKGFMPPLSSRESPDNIP